MAVEKPSCAYHPERTATAACERCGAFSCSLCLRQHNDGLCIDCLTRRRREEQSSVWSWLNNPQSRMATAVMLLLLLLPVGFLFIAWLMVRM